MSLPGNGWGEGFKDAGMFDTRLTPLGEQQAAELNVQLKTVDYSHVQLIVVSPLTRALRTAQLVFDGVDVPRIACSLCAERVYMSPEVGRPASVLQGEFPEVSFRELDPHKPWWFQGDSVALSPEWRPQGSYLVPGEPWGVFKNRLEGFLMFLAVQPETDIAVVCHYGVVHALTGLQMGNCEAKQFDLGDLQQHTRIMQLLEDE